VERPGDADAQAAITDPPAPGDDPWAGLWRNGDVHAAADELFALYALYSGRCGRPGCTRPIDVIHHIIHWLYGGKTQVINGAPVCLYDHWLVHEGGWRVSKQPDGALTFIPPPPGWRPGTIYRRGKPLPETSPHQDAA